MASVSESKPNTSEAEDAKKANQNGVNKLEETSKVTATEDGAKRDENEETAISETGTGNKRFGKVKWFNVTKGWGFIAAEDGSQDVFVHQSVIKMEGFRSLAEGERVEFEARQSEKGLEATVVTGPDGNPCLGSNRHPTTKKKYRKARCYNCGEFANHVAARCDKGVMPKRCHNCRSEDHLIKDCPLKIQNSSQKQNGHPDTASPDADSGTAAGGATGAGTSESETSAGSGEVAAPTQTTAPAAATTQPETTEGEPVKTTKTPKKK